MNVLVISLQGVSLCLSHKAKQEGHDLIYYIEQEDCREIGDGIVWKTTDPDALAE